MDTDIVTVSSTQVDDVTELPEGADNSDELPSSTDCVEDITSTSEGKNIASEISNGCVENVKIETTANGNSKSDSEMQDTEENFIVVMNETSKFNARVKPDTSTFTNFCERCDAVFRWPYQLKNHISVAHEGKYPYICKICGKKFEHLKSFRDHKYVHTEDRPYACKLCSSAFKMKGGLNKHIRDIHTDNKIQFKCEYCDRIFKCKEKLASHFFVHTEKSYSCDICGKKFSRKNNVKEHRVIHSLEKTFECQDCGMKFNRKYALKVHQRNHMEVRPYKCDFCEKSFSQSHALKSHIRLHTGERPYKCQHCDRSFKQVGTLQVHTKRHLGEKNFTCGICQRSFVIHRRLTEHMRTHTGEKPYQCEFCPYRAATTTGLLCHKKTHERRLQRQLNAQKGDNPDETKDAETNSENLVEKKKKQNPTTARKSKVNKVKPPNDLPKKSKQKKSSLSSKIPNGDHNKSHVGGKLLADSIQKCKNKSTKRKSKASSSSKADKQIQMDYCLIPIDNGLIDVGDNINDDMMLMKSDSIKEKSKQPKSSQKSKRKRDKKQTIHKEQTIKEKLFANALLQGANFTPIKTEPGYSRGVLNDVVKHDLSLIDEAIKNLANSIIDSKVNVNGGDDGFQANTSNVTNVTNVSNLQENGLGVQVKSEKIDFDDSQNYSLEPAYSHLMNIKLEEYPQDLVPTNNDLAPVPYDLKPISNHLTTVSNRFATASNDLLPISNDLEPVSNHIEPLSNHSAQISNDLAAISNDLASISNDLAPVSDVINTVSKGLAGLSHNLVPVSSGFDTISNGIVVNPDKICIQTDDLIVIRNDSSDSE